MNYSRQRVEVLEQLKCHLDHPTADAIFSELRCKDPNISLATVYRNLKLLSELGEIRRLNFTDGADRFDPNTSPHYHFICKDCGKVMDIPMEVADTLDQTANRFIQGSVSGHELLFYGQCRDCQKKAEQ